MYKNRANKKGELFSKMKNADSESDDLTLKYFGLSHDEIS